LVKLPWVIPRPVANYIPPLQIEALRLFSLQQWLWLIGLQRWGL
jgi:hypothetical protein